MSPLVVPVSLSGWPIRPSLGALGRKWALPVIRDLHTLGEARFSELLRRNPGMSERILSLRLRDLRREGLVERVSDPDDRRQVPYRLTPRGRSAIPILEGLVLFGIMQLAADVFGPRGPPRPRSERSRPGRRDRELP
ncbi:MAG TPA: winged helix-turn-helix transcriptional regulator [Thermoplasmata archaeon]|nr:winged helix-turn-helix transcriptional regulator [Thermoplasmata archaeon]